MLDLIILVSDHFFFLLEMYCQIPNQVLERA